MKHEGSSGGRGRPAAEPATPGQVAELLRLSTMTLATCGADGEPHAAAVFFAADEGLNLYFFSAEDSRHGQDLADDARAAASVYPECRDWRDIRGLQLRGEVRPLGPGEEWEGAWRRYAAKFPFVEELREVVARNRFYVFTPHWIRLVDNRRGFGYKEEFAAAGRAEPGQPLPGWRQIAPGEGGGGGHARARR